jgi:hypothetical protein
MTHAGTMVRELSWPSVEELDYLRAADQDEDASYPLDDGDAYYDYEGDRGDQEYGLWDSEIDLLAARMGARDSARD